MKSELSYISENEKRFLSELFEVLRIPSVSALPEHSKDIRLCVDWLTNHLRQIGFPEVSVYKARKGHPVIYASWEVNKNKPTVLVYGHYDVQPPDPIEKWTTTPFSPEIRSGKIYARGANDDKGQLFTHIKAIETLCKTRVIPPINFKLLIEGEEEVAGENVEWIVRNYPKTLAADAVCISDTGLGSWEVPCITYGLRGILFYELIVRTAAQDLHSGTFGGAALNPFKLLSRLLSEAEENGTVLLPGFYKNVREATPEEKELILAADFSEKEFARKIGAPFLGGEKEYPLPVRIGLRPTFEIHGMPGGFTGEGSKTVIPATASAKVSMRLVPDQDPEEIAFTFERWAKSQIPLGLLEVKRLGTGNWWVADVSNPIYEKARKALTAGFGAQKTGAIYCGGSIPIVPTLAETLKCPIVLMGFGLDEDNLHSPDESFALDRFFGGIKTMINFYNEMSL